MRTVDEMVAFGADLIMTNDLDPVYNALVGARLPGAQLKRLLLAYWCFYHLGAAAWLSEQEGASYWKWMEAAARNAGEALPTGFQATRWPRGAERRHFRGVKCIAAVEQLAALSNQRPEELVDGLVEPDVSSRDRITFGAVSAQAQRWPLFGPWIAFKIADMLERVLRLPVEFPEDITLFYKEPRAALGMLDVPAEAANQQLLARLSCFPAPPWGDRNSGIQEVETVACKAKSFWGGHYWVGKDIHEVCSALGGWGETAGRLLASMPREVARGLV